MIPAFPGTEFRHSGSVHEQLSQKTPENAKPNKLKALKAKPIFRSALENESLSVSPALWGHTRDTCGRTPM